MKDKFWAEPHNWLIGLVLVAYASGIILWGAEKLGWIEKSLAGTVYLVMILIPIVASPFVWVSIMRRHRIELAKISARAGQRS